MPRHRTIAFCAALAIVAAMPTLASAQRLPSAQSEIRMTYEIVAGEYVFRADGRYPSTRSLIKALRSADEPMTFRPLTLTSRQLTALERRATGRTPVYTAVGLTVGSHVGVQVFRFGPKGAVALPPTAPGNAVLITRADRNRPATSWWMVSNKNEALSDARYGAFYGSSRVTARW